MGHLHSVSGVQAGSTLLPSLKICEVQRSHGPFKKRLITPSTRPFKVAGGDHGGPSSRKGNRVLFKSVHGSKAKG